MKLYPEKLMWIIDLNNCFGLDYAKGLSTETWEDAPLTWRNHGMVGGGFAIILGKHIED